MHRYKYILYKESLDASSRLRRDALYGTNWLLLVLMESFAQYIPGRTLSIQINKKPRYHHEQ